MRRLLRRPDRAWLYWLAPPLFTVWVYWSGLRAWFLADDFAWLALWNDIHRLQDLWPAIFQPTVQGTLRPWSDRVFFLAFRALFDLDARPYHLWIFATQMAAAVLSISIVRRLTGSKLAGFLAPLFWTGNAVLVMSMMWACLYKDILCAFTLLLAFHFLLRYIETGRERYNVYQWIVFLLGFGVMETNVVYPAIAVTYTLLRARHRLRQAFALVVPSILYLALNLLFVRKQTAGPYALHFDRHLPLTFLQYWTILLKPDARLLDDDWLTLSIPAALTLCLMAYVVVRWRRNDRLPAFFLSWSLFALAPVLPLRDQVQTYYATGAAVGIAMLAAHALATAWQSGRRVWRAAAVVVALVFLIPSVRLARSEGREWRRRGLRAQAVVLGVAQARFLHPEQAIVLDRVDTHLYWDLFPDRAFRAIDVSGVYLSPGAAAAIAPIPHHPAPGEFALPPAAFRNPERIEIYAAGIPLRNITREYFDRLPDVSGLPHRIDLASSWLDDLLGGTWHTPEPGHRWMGKQATLRLAAPQHSGESLHILAYCPETVLVGGPVALQVSINGAAQPPVPLRLGEVRLSFPLRQEWIAETGLDVVLEVPRTFRLPNDDRDLGLPIVAVEIR